MSEIKSPDEITTEIEILIRLSGVLKQFFFDGFIIFKSVI